MWHRAFPTLALIAMCACGGEEQDNGFDRAAHEAVCAKFVEVGCTDTTLERCLTTSENTYEKYAACRGAYNAWAACAASKGEVTCGDVGYVIGNCETEQTAYGDCLAANTSD